MANCLISLNIKFKKLEIYKLNVKVLGLIIHNVYGHVTNLRYTFLSSC